MPRWELRPPSGELLRGAWRRLVARQEVEEAGWRYCGQPPVAGLAPGSHSQCSHRGIVSVCRGVLGARRPNLKAEVTVQQEGEEGVTEVYRDPAAAAADGGAAAEVGAAAGADAGTVCADAGDRAPPLPQPPCGPHAPGPRQASCRCFLQLPPPLPASAAAAASSAAVAGTKSHMWGSIGWCSSRCGPPSPAGDPG